MQPTQSVTASWGGRYFPATVNSNYGVAVIASDSKAIEQYLIAVSAARTASQKP